MGQVLDAKLGGRKTARHVLCLNKSVRSRHCPFSRMALALPVHRNGQRDSHADMPDTPSSPLPFFEVTNSKRTPAERPTCEPRKGRVLLTNASKAHITWASIVALLLLCPGICEILRDRDKALYKRLLQYVGFCGQTGNAMPAFVHTHVRRTVRSRKHHKSNPIFLNARLFVP